MAKPKPIQERTNPECYVCGDKGLVPRAYIEPTCGAVAGRDLVRCPKCPKIKKEKSS